MLFETTGKSKMRDIHTIQNLHWSIDNEGHHDVHVSNVLLQVWIRQVQLCAPVSNIKS